MCGPHAHWPLQSGGQRLDWYARGKAGTIGGEPCTNWHKNWQRVRGCFREAGTYRQCVWDLWEFLLSSSVVLATTGNAAEVITRRWKAAVVRRRYRRIQAAALTMQKHWRGVLERRLVAKARRGIPKLIATFLSKRAKARYQEMRRAATVLSRYACWSVALSVSSDLWWACPSC